MLGPRLCRETFIILLLSSARVLKAIVHFTQRVKSESGSALASPCRNVRIERSRFRNVRHSCGCDHFGSLRCVAHQQGNQATAFGGANPRRNALIRLFQAWEIRCLSKTTSLQLLDRLFRQHLMLPCPNRRGVHKMPVRVMQMQTVFGAGCWPPCSCACLYVSTARPTAVHGHHVTCLSHG